MAQLINAGAAIASVFGLFTQASGASKEAEALQQQQELQSQAERRSAIRKSIIARADLRASAAGVGALQSSAVAGGLGSVSSQLGSGLGFQSQYSALSQDISQARSQQTFGGFLSGVGSQAFQQTGGFNTLFQIQEQQPSFR